MMKKSLCAFVLLTVAATCHAEWLSGDLKNLNVADGSRTWQRFTASCVGDNGEYYKRLSQNSSTIQVFSSVDSFFSGGSATRSITMTGLGSHSEFTWVKGRIIVSRTGGGQPLRSYDPQTGGGGNALSINNGNSSAGWGGTAGSFIACDGNYFYNHRDSTLDIYDLDFNFLRTTSIITTGTLGGGFAAGGYYYPVEYSTPTLDRRYKGSDASNEAVNNQVIVPCGYQTHFTFDYFGNNLLHTGGNAGGSGGGFACADTARRYSTALDGPPSGGGAVVPATSTTTFLITLAIFGLLFVGRISRSA